VLGKTTANVSVVFPNIPWPGGATHVGVDILRELASASGDCAGVTLEGFPETIRRYVLP